MLRLIQFKLIVTAILGSFSTFAATTYYVDAEKGDDANDGTASESAWKTTGRVNSAQMQLKPGDTVLFRGGQSFAGPLVLTAAGSETAPISYGKFGDGDKPELTGFVTAGGWKMVAKGVYEAHCPSVSVSAPNMLTINGKAYALGRFPNADAPNGGYLTVDKHAGKTSLTDAELPAAPDWTGAEVVIRKYRWVIDRSLITAHKDHTLTFKTVSAYEPVDQHGYFIQNDPRTLDVFGEWYFHPQTKMLRVFFGDNDPAKSVVKLAGLERLVVAANRQDICFSDLKFTGANEVALLLDGSTRMAVRHCDIRWSGTYGIRGEAVKHFTLEDSVLEDTHSNAVAFKNGVSNSVIRRVTIRNTAVFPGMGLSGDGTYNALTLLHGNDNLIEAFNIINTGYIPVHFQGSRITVRNGFIDTFAFIKDDSGGIYTWTGAADKNVYTDRKITGNIVLNSRGATAGAVGEAKGYGIYLDDVAANVEVSGNTVAHTSGGIFLHNAHHCQITKNTFFDNDVQLLITHDGIDPAAQAEIRAITFADNILVARTHLQQILSSNSMTDDAALFGKFARNVYARPADQNLIIDHEVKDAAPQAYDLEGHRAVTGLDADTRPAAVRVLPYKIEKLGPNLVANGEFTKNVNDASCWTRGNTSAVTWVDGKLDAGTLQHAYKKGTNTPNASLVLINAGPLNAGKRYLLKFSLLGSGKHGSAAVRLRQGVQPWGGVTEHQFVKIDTTRRECELLFTCGQNQSASAIEWSFNERDGNFWLDNVALHEAVVTDADERNFFFRYNIDGESKTIDLDQEYVDVLGAAAGPKVTLPPRGSVVLVRKGALITEKLPEQ